MQIGEIVEIGERIVETPKVAPREPERPSPAPEKRPERVKEPA